MSVPGFYSWFVLLSMITACIAAEFEWATTPANTRCKATHSGWDYHGKRRFTHDKQQCLFWSEVNVTYVDEQFVHGDVNSSENYCRSPQSNQVTMIDLSERQAGPWCHTSSGWGYCNIEPCIDRKLKTRHCVNGNGFMSYVGNFTLGSSVCMRWSDASLTFIPLENFAAFNKIGAPTDRVELQNYCRNPDNDVSLWCYNSTEYLMHGRLMKAYCSNVPVCSSACRLTEGSLEYVGVRDKSESGRPCLPAQKYVPKELQSAAEKKHWFESRYINDLYEEPLTSCRSYPAQMKPGNSTKSDGTALYENVDGPVCFVQHVHGNVIEEQCEIPYCTDDDALAGYTTDTPESLPAEFKWATLPANSRCKATDSGWDYTGKRSYTSEQEVCLQWSDVNVTYTDDQFVHDNLIAAENFCRSPLLSNVTTEIDLSERQAGPWCHTASGWGYCNINPCCDIRSKTRDCVKGNGFMSYVGSFTLSGMRCMRWDDPSINFIPLEYFTANDKSGVPSNRAELQNFCRNPDNDVALWCFDHNEYLEMGNLKKAYCSEVTVCSSRCRISEGSLEYVGPEEKSESGRPCLAAQENSPSIFQSDAEIRQWFESRYINDLYERPLKYCRSYPAQLDYNVNVDGPVCFVEDENGQVIEERCPIPYCRFDVLESNTADENLFVSLGVTTGLPTEPQPTTTAAVKNATTTSVEVGNAWRLIKNFEIEERSDQESSESGRTVGIIILAILGVILLGFAVFDIVLFIIKYKMTASEQRDPLLGSSISFRRFHQVSPTASEKTVATTAPWSQSWSRDEHKIPLSKSQQI